MNLEHMPKIVSTIAVYFRPFDRRNDLPPNTIQADEVHHLTKVTTKENLDRIISNMDAKDLLVTFIGIGTLSQSAVRMMQEVSFQSYVVSLLGLVELPNPFAMALYITTRSGSQRNSHLRSPRPSNG